jgi:hypothetical protein
MKSGFTSAISPPGAKKLSTALDILSLFRKVQSSEFAKVFLGGSVISSSGIFFRSEVT